MNQALVYLSGPVAGLTYNQAEEWREYASRCLPPHLQGVSPMRGHRMLQGRGAITDGMMDYPLRTDQAITRRDKYDTLRADAVLVNVLGATKASINTVMELAWAADHGIPAVIAMEPEGNPHDHPMVRDSCLVRVASLDEAIKAVVTIASTHDKYDWTRIEQNQILKEDVRLNLTHESLKEIPYSGHPKRR